MKLRFKNNPLFLGVISSSGLVFFYLSFLTLFNGVSHAVDQFKLYSNFILLLSIGFGVQVGLFFYMHKKINDAKTMKATSGMSAGSMIACCAHHVTDLIPVLGISAFGLFLANYQKVFMIFGILSNLIGISFMLREMQKLGLLQNSFMKNFSMNQVFKTTTVVSILFFIGYALAFQPPGSGIDVSQSTNVLTGFAMLSDSQLGVVFDVLPIIESNQLVFDIAINNHKYDLDFDLTKVSTLTLDNGSILRPVLWEGNSGGHHVYGKLYFQNLRDFKSFKLEINALETIRIFEWLN